MKIFGGTILKCVTIVVGVSATLVPAQAVPVVPNFTQGSMTSHTENDIESGLKLLILLIIIQDGNTQ